MTKLYRTINNTIIVTYPAREQEQTVTVAEYNLIRGVENKIRSIKFIREQYSLGLYEAKQVVDTILENPQITF